MPVVFWGDTDSAASGLVIQCALSVVGMGPGTAEKKEVRHKVYEKTSHAEFRGFRLLNIHCKISMKPAPFISTAGLLIMFISNLLWENSEKCTLHLFLTRFINMQDTFISELYLFFF